MAPSWRSKDVTRFQIMSDLHLEVHQQYQFFHIQPRAPYLILAGDIGRLADYQALGVFLISVCSQFLRVYMVLGNHEFFGVSRVEGLPLASELQEKPFLKGKLRILNRKRVDLDDVTILGCTLQSYIPPESREIVRQKVNDFRGRIGGWTVETHVAEHRKDVAWLNEEITTVRKEAGGKRQKILVVTHHAPSMTGTSDPAYDKHIWSAAFGTDLLGKYYGSRLNDVQCWIYGHTHYSTDFMKEGVLVVSNQRGYVVPGNEGQKPSGFLGSIAQRIRRSDPKSRHCFDTNKVIEL